MIERQDFRAADAPLSNADALRAFGIQNPTAAQERAVHAVRSDLARVLVGADDPAALAGLLGALVSDLELPPQALSELGRRLERAGWSRVSL